jgi:hypothetical protein
VQEEYGIAESRTFLFLPLFTGLRGIGILGRWDEKADPHTQYPVGLQLLDGL